jgi:S-adenosylmethionine:tRNA ribosyltransferase-isomerase
MDPRQLSIASFDYHLPDELIAKYPLPERDASKLLVYKNDQIIVDSFHKLDRYLPAETLLVFNDTRVIPARLLFQKNTGGMIELFCLAPDPRYGSVVTAMSQHSSVYWECLIGKAGKWKPGQPLEKECFIDGRPVNLRAEYVNKTAGAFRILFEWDMPGASFADILESAGNVPLPPYIKRAAEGLDKDRYQTVFARNEGSVAAPTAGLHFTLALIEKLQRSRIQMEYVSLQVGAGTFKPVKSATMEEHEMHGEIIEVGANVIEHIARMGAAPVAAVGTTSLRTIETLYWLGVKLNHNHSQQQDPGDLLLELGQWEAYSLPQNIEPVQALNSLLEWMHDHQLRKLAANTQLLIAPGYTFRLVNALVTNFHQPRSTLLLLVAAFVGDNWAEVYRYALDHSFRFLSYGDGSLLWRSEPL